MTREFRCLLDIISMYSAALAGEIFLYTNRNGLYQSLLDLSVISYVS